jgi:probable F420-dependent oxidoreductase
MTSQPTLKVRIGIGLGVHEMVHHRDEVRAICRAAEDEGFDSLWFSDVAASYALDPLAALGFVAAATERIKMGTSVLVVPGRQPAVLAKALATLDLLSSGRVLPIVGLGTVHPDEQQAFAVKRSERGPWFEEAVPLLRRFWTEEKVVHHGRQFTVDGFGVHPRPGRPLPIWFGGADPRELRRVGRLADGWLASFTTPAEVAAGIAAIRAAAVEHGRSIDDDHYGVLMLYSLRPPAAEVRDFIAWRRPDLPLEAALPVGGAALRTRIAEFIAAGASKFVLIPAERPEDWAAELAELAGQTLALQTPDRSDPQRRRPTAVGARP